MSFELQSEMHFLNIIRKAIKENFSLLCDEELFPENFYKKMYKFDNRMAKRFTWEIITSPNILIVKNLINWLENDKIGKDFLENPASKEIPQILDNIEESQKDRERRLKNDELFKHLNDER
jgi:hypothetical protein